MQLTLRCGLVLLAILAVVSGSALADNPVRCSKPGELITNDIDGDVGPLGGPGNDVDAYYIMEHPGPGSNRITFVIDMVALDPANPPLAATIYVVFTVGGATRFVSAQTCDATQIPSFSYGTVDPTSGAFLGDGPTTGQLLTNRWCIDASAAQIPALVPGATLTNVRCDSRVFAGAQCSGLVSQVDVTAFTTVFLCGADACEAVPTDETTWGRLKDGYR